MESNREEMLNELIDIITLMLLALGLVLVGWFLGDWVIVATGSKPYFDVFTVISVARVILGIMFIIGSIFGRMIEKKKVGKLSPY